MDGFYKLGGGVPVFLLYDITSIYFEGEGIKIAKRGYSRDHRGDRPQVLLGVALNERGFPVYFDIFSGNVPDKETVGDVIEDVKKRFGIKKAIFVGDRGMISMDNIGKVSGKEFGYIMAIKHREARELLKDKKVEPSLFDKRIPVTIYQEEKKKYVLCGSEYRKGRDEAVLEGIIKRGKKELRIVKRMVKKGRIKDREKIIRRAQKKLTKSGAEEYLDFSYTDGRLKIIEKEEEIENAKRLCGYYILETSEVDMKEEEVEKHYKGLQQVERCFRDLKELLEIRPIYHWADRRVKSHIFLCLISQVILSYVRKELKEKGWLGRNNTLEKFITLLTGVKLGKFLIGGKGIMEVQKDNPLEKVLSSVFQVSSFNYERDRASCSI
jgi:transposase